MKLQNSRTKVPLRRHRSSVVPALQHAPCGALRTYPGKRCLDIVGAVVALVLTFPLQLLIALAVKITSPGPVFYRAHRCGLGGSSFYMYKFRTMQTQIGSKFTARNDPRITKIGKFLRFTKLDELPNLINVLRGEMSIIGPRPEDASVVQTCYDPEQRRVLTVRPGLSCLVEVRNFPDNAHLVPDGVDADEYYQGTLLSIRLQDDLEYIDRMSLSLDLWIMLATIYCIAVSSWIVLWRGLFSKRTTAHA